jgi:hypothetical protein
MSFSLRRIRRRLAPLAVLTLLVGGVAAPVATAPVASAQTSIVPHDFFSYIYGYYFDEGECIDQGQVGIDDHNWVNYSCYYTLVDGKDWWWALDVVVSYTT